MHMHMCMCMHMYMCMCMCMLYMCMDVHVPSSPHHLPPPRDLVPQMASRRLAHPSDHYYYNYYYHYYSTDHEPPPRAGWCGVHDKTVADPPVLAHAGWQ